MSEVPSMFSKGNPNLQVAWDATSLNAFTTCPRYYKYTIVDGWRTAGSSIDIEFGALFASSVERFKKARLEGKSRDEAQIVALRYAMEHSGTYVAPEYHETNTDNPIDFPVSTWVPWGGQYREQWHCTGTEPYKNEKGNKAKCPFAHKGVWQEDTPPSICGWCGSPIETAVNWVPHNPAKDRYALIRAVVWYAEEQPEDLDSALAAIALPDGTPAVELSFRIPLQEKSPYGEPYILAGYLDSIVKFGDELFIADDKTTKKMLTKQFWEGFQPHTQFDTYDLAGSIMFPDLNIRGIMIEGTQLLVGGARFGKHPVYHNEDQREEWYFELTGILKEAEGYAERNYWPMRRSSCPMCVFKKVCSKSPGVREQYLANGDFVKRHWNPLEER